MKNIPASTAGNGRPRYLRRAARVVTMVLACCIVLPAATSAAKPNIVIILADDFGWGDTSCNNPKSQLPTPAIDRIAKEGIRFTNAHTPAAVCSPSRYGLLTGRYPWRTYLKIGGMNGYVPALIPKGRATIASYLKTQGYRTGGFGKWHLGLGWPLKEGGTVGWSANWDFNIGRAKSKKYSKTFGQSIDLSKPLQNSPVDLGFDTYFGTVANGTKYPYYMQDNRILVESPGPVRNQVDDIYVAKAIAFIENHEKNHPNSPFFVYLPLNAIHGAVSPPKRYVGKSKLSSREDKILWANESVEAMLATLDRLKLTSDTLVIFTADNGPIHSEAGRQKGHLAAGPYRGFKTNFWEGGTHVPFLARWPKHIPAGVSTDHMIGLVDVFATIAALSDSTLPDGAAPDSVNQLPALLQDKGKIVKRPALVTASYNGFLAIRQHQWKALFGTKWSGGIHSTNYGSLPPKDIPPDSSDIGQLYNIADDPYETKDLWESNPEVVETLRNTLQKIKKQHASDPLPETTPSKQ